VYYIKSAVEVPRASLLVFHFTEQSYALYPTLSTGDLTLLTELHHDSLTYVVHYTAV